VEDLDDPRQQHRSHVSVVVRGDTDALVTRAEETGVLIPAIPGRSWLRASCRNRTNDHDIKRLRHVLRLAQS
jgi:hypothetical protein